MGCNDCGAAICDHVFAELGRLATAASHDPARAMLSRLLAAGFDQAEFGLLAMKDPTNSPPLVWRFRGCVYGINEWIAYDWVGEEPDLARIEEEVAGRLRAKLDESR